MKGLLFWLFYVFMKRHAAAALNACLALRSKGHRRQKEGTVMTYFEAVKYLLEMYATDDLITKTDSDMTRFT